MPWREWYPDIDDDKITLQEARDKMPVESIQVPFLVWLIENPKSFISFPGWTDIDIHDYMHIILGKDLSPNGEAFVIGFCMGNNRKTRNYHVFLFKFISRYFYPKHYKFNLKNLIEFDKGFSYGQNIKYKNINESQFKNCRNYSLSWVRYMFGIKKDDLRSLCAN